MRWTNLRHLRVFDAVARLGSFIEASRALHMTPAAVSLAIRDLEINVGFRVFERTTRMVRLTEAGQAYFLAAERVLAEVRAAEECATALRDGTAATVRIATTPAATSSLLRVLFEKAAELWPSIRFTIVEVPTQQMSEAINMRLADMVIGARLFNDDHNDSRLLFRSRWVALVPRSHALARRRSLTWREIEHARIVVINESSRLGIQSALPSDIVLDNVQSFSTANFALASTASGYGIAVVPGYVRSLAQVHELKIVPISDPEIEHLMEICIARRPEPAPYIVEMRDYLLQNVQEACGAYA